MKDAPSILEPEWELPFENPQCFICGCETRLQRHHIMSGPNRRLSQRYGLWVTLCEECHLGSRGAQYDSDVGNYLKNQAQMAFEEKYSHEEWMEIFKKNYL